MKIDLKDWHKEVCERDGYVCRGCYKEFDFPCYFQGEVNQMVCGHHKKTRKAFPELTLDVENGVCVCLPCHNKVHNGELNI